MLVRLPATGFPLLSRTDSRKRYLRCDSITPQFKASNLRASGYDEASELDTGFSQLWLRRENHKWVRLMPCLIVRYFLATIEEHEGLIPTTGFEPNFLQL